jgi:hypothetical protein
LKQLTIAEVMQRISGRPEVKIELIDSPILTQQCNKSDQSK